jgi:immune inhibitor A
MKRQFFSLFLIFMAATAMWAAPALRGSFTVTQADGTLLTVEQFGDEFFHWTETADGTLVIPTRQGYFVAVIDDKGELTASDVLAHEAQLRSSKERQLVNQQATRRVLFHQQGQRVRAERRAMSISVSNKYLPHAGSPRILTILAAYQDVDFIVNEPKLAFDQYLNGDEIVDFGNNNTLQLCSVRQYFNTCSNGLFTPQFDVVGPVKLPQDMAYYGGTSATGSDDKFYQLCMNAYQAVKDSVADWSLYDNDKDGNVELVCIIFAGYGQNQGGENNTIWAKASRPNIAIDNDMRISFFNCCSELFNPAKTATYDYSQYINGTGTFIHEMSHCMGLPDLYQTTGDYANNQGMESWSIMDYGLYNRNGFAPAPYNAWEREVMGWSLMEPISAPTQVNLLKPWEDGGTAYKIVNSSDDNEYIVMENIQKRGLNKYAKGHGLLVYHVAYPYSEINMTDRPNNTVGRPAVAVVPASGLFINIGLARNNKPHTRAEWTASMASAPFPGDSAVTGLTLQQELPNYVFYSGDPLNVELHNITESEDGSVSFDFVEAPASGISTLKVKPETLNDNSYYILDGRKVNGQSLKKGIYLHQGKKIVIH